MLSINFSAVQSSNFHSPFTFCRLVVMSNYTFIYLMHNMQITCSNAAACKCLNLSLCVLYVIKRCGALQPWLEIYIYIYISANEQMPCTNVFIQTRSRKAQLETRSPESNICSRVRAEPNVNRQRHVLARSLWP